MEKLKQKSDGNRLLTGVFLLAIGILFLLNKMGVNLPWWLFSWQMFLIALGLFLGVKHNFKNPAWIILIAIGSIFLWDDITDGTNIKAFLVPIILISLGLFFIFYPKSKNNWEDNEFLGATTSGEDGVDSVAIFGGIKKIILSKNFKGGNIVSIMGGTDLNLMQADIQGKILIEVVNVMGGTKLIIPSNWDVQSDETVSIFGGLDDKRMITPDGISADKVVVIRGVNIFGGIEIKSY
jgi:predicted membrane protein